MKKRKTVYMKRKKFQKGKNLGKKLKLKKEVIP